MVAGLDDKKQLLRWGQGLLESHGIVVAHFIPGRVRLRARLLKGNQVLAQTIIERFGIIKGVKAVEANHLTGSLVIAYNLAELRTPDSRGSLGEALCCLVPHLDKDKLLQLLSWL